MAWIQLSLPASLLASFGMCDSGRCISTLSSRRTERSCSLLSFPEAVAWRLAVSHTSPWGRGAGVAPASCGSPGNLSLCLTRQGEKLPPVSVGTCRQDSHVDPKACPFASGCTDFLSELIFVILASGSWYCGEDSGPEPTSPITHTHIHTPQLVECIAENLPHPFLSNVARSQNSHSCITIKLHWSDL